MNTKTEIRENLSADVAAFLASGGHVTLIASRKIRAKATVTGKQKLSLAWSAPKNRPSQNWDMIETKR
jgi:hypothetical protein